MTDLHPIRRFILSSDSLSVYGADRLTTPIQTMGRTELARLVTPDAAAMIAEYWEAVSALDDRVGANHLRRWSRLIGKDLLKCLRWLILIRGGEYEVGVRDIHRQAGIYAPELARLADLLFMLYRDPTADPSLLSAALDCAQADLLPTLPSLP